jgi:fructokinase
MILVCGEALFDLFLGEQTGISIGAQAVAGGSPFNVAVGLARMGLKAGFFGGIARDRLGDALFDLLASEGVETRFVPRKDLSTTLSVVASGPDGSPRYSFYGAGAADRMVTPADLPAALPDGVKAITFGSYSIAVDPVGETLLALAERESGRRVISIDPNLRPTVVGDLAAWEARFARFLPTATLIKASDEDIEIAYGGRRSVPEVARAWLAAGPACVVVTRGGQGAVAFLREGGVVDLPGRPVNVVDTVGAGDTFHAALLAALDDQGRLSPDALATIDSKALGEAVSFAILASSITCTRRGADLPTRADIEKERP